MTPGSSVAGSLDFGLDLLNGFILFVSNKIQAIQPLGRDRLAGGLCEVCQHLLGSTCWEPPVLDPETRERKSSRPQSQATKELVGQAQPRPQSTPIPHLSLLLTETLGSHQVTLRVVQQVPGDGQHPAH